MAKLSASIPMGENKGVKDAMEKAYQTGPSQEEVIAAFESLTFDSPSGKMSMSLGKGHQASWARLTAPPSMVNGKATSSTSRLIAENASTAGRHDEQEWIKGRDEGRK